MQTQIINRNGNEKAEPCAALIPLVVLPIPPPNLAPGVLWYAIETRYRFEKRALAHLSHKGVDTFLPTFAEVRRWTDRNKRVQTLLFSGYGFVQISLSGVARMTVLQTEGVIRFVAVRGVAVPIPAEQIQAVRLLLSQGVTCAAHAFLTTGQRVRIRGGCLDGVEGIFEQERQGSMVISIEAIQRAVAIRIEGYELDLL